MAQGKNVGLSLAPTILSGYCFDKLPLSFLRQKLAQGSNRWPTSHQPSTTLWLISCKKLYQPQPQASFRNNGERRWKKVKLSWFTEGYERARIYSRNYYPSVYYYYHGGWVFRRIRNNCVNIIAPSKTPRMFAITLPTRRAKVQWVWERLWALSSMQSPWTSR